MRYHAPEAELNDFYADLEEANLQPLWEMSGLLTPEPVVKALPSRWSATVLRKLAARAGELVPIERGGDRRVLAMSNPGLDGAPFVSGTLWAAVQYLQAGEVAPAHRHTPGALRFVLEGGGVYTLLDSDPVAMERGDLVLTPSWVYHEHHNPSENAMMWLDVLDLPIVAALDAVFFEEGPSEEPNRSVAESSATERAFGQGAGLTPAGVSLVRHDQPHSPLMVYRWAETTAALDALLELGDGREAELQFRDPSRDRDVMPTMRCHMRRVVGGVTTGCDQQTGSRVCAVLNGEGTVHLGTEEFSLSEGDVFVVPSWCEYRLMADRTIDVFTTSDAPILEALGVFRSVMSH